LLAHKLSLGDHEFDLEYVRLGMRADPNKARIHLSAYHPDFLFVSADLQGQVVAQVLDWALGEDDVARWIGEVTIATEQPVDSLPPSTLAAVVAQIAEPFQEPAWLSGEGRTPRGHPAHIAVLFPLHRQDYPLCDLHVSVSLPYANSNPDRLPVAPSSTALNAGDRRRAARLSPVRGPGLRCGRRARPARRRLGGRTGQGGRHAGPGVARAGALPALAAGAVAARALVAG
jgi:hypothetical protein